MGIASVQVIFPLTQDADGYPPAQTERLWATAVGPHLYRIDNVPFFVTRVSLNDVVSAAQDERGNLWFAGHISQSGHKTLRILVTTPSLVANLREALKQLKCDTERSHLPSLIAVDIPPEVDFRAVMDFVSEGERRGDWEYEEASV